MKTISYKFINGITFVLLFAGIVAGQETVEVVFTCYDWAHQGIDTLYYRNGDTFEEIRMRNLGRSRPYAYTGPQTFRLYRKVAVEVAAPGTVVEADGGLYQACAEVLIPPTHDRILLIITPEKEDPVEKKYRIFVLEESLEIFPKNSFRLVNFSEEPLFFRVGDRPAQTLASGGRVTVYPLQDGTGFTPVLFMNGTGELLYSSKWYSDSTTRDLVFLRSEKDSVGKTVLSVRIITEVVTEPDTPQN